MELLNENYLNITIWKINFCNIIIYSHKIITRASIVSIIYS